MKKLKYVLKKLNEADESDIILDEQNEEKEKIIQYYKEKITEIIEDDSLGDLESLYIIESITDELLRKIKTK